MEEIQVRLVCKLWKLSYDALLNGVLKLNGIQFAELNLSDPQNFFAYLGPIDLYYDLAVKLQTITPNSELCTFNVPEVEGFRAYSKPTKLTQLLSQKYGVNPKKIHTPIAVTPHRLNRRQILKICAACPKFAIFSQAQTSTIKDLTKCDTCNRICSHCDVALGKICTEDKVLININTPVTDLEKIFSSESYDEDNDPICVIDETGLNRLLKYIRIIGLLGYRYLFYFTGTGDISIIG